MSQKKASMRTSKKAKITQKGIREEIEEAVNALAKNVLSKSSQIALKKAEMEAKVEQQEQAVVAPQ